MLTIDITEEAADAYDMAMALRRISELLLAGYTSGYEPTWRLEGDEEDESGD